MHEFIAVTRKVYEIEWALIKVPEIYIPVHHYDLTSTITKVAFHLYQLNTYAVVVDCEEIKTLHDHHGVVQPDQVFGPAYRPSVVAGTGTMLPAIIGNLATVLKYHIIA
jgi:hypothetical protein